jgi:hypothetical protein
MERRPGTQRVPEVSKRAGRYRRQRELDPPLCSGFARLTRIRSNARTAMVKKLSVGAAPDALRASRDGASFG